MGLLDDAIREHLDLKRRRGGDPVEIERAEQEALGPVRRAPEGVEQELAAPGAESEEPLDHEYEAEPEWDQSFAEDDEAVGPPATAGHADEPMSEPPERSEPSDPPPPGEHGGQETAEYDVEQQLERRDEDVLEETPEFLQETPEHDRLWFEQRPPKDFDFDG